MVKSSEHFTAKVLTRNHEEIDCWYDEKREVLMIELPINKKEKAQIIYIQPLEITT